MQLRASYERDGYVFPIEVMTPGRAAEYRALFESVEAAHAHDPVASRIVKGFASIVLPFVDEIMRLPSLLGPVKAILGDDLLVMGANLFIKEPETPAFVSWHQDLTY
jgi:non-heme Fe2+,alpha-ketoglutarate-dependent halogenase